MTWTNRVPEEEGWYWLREWAEGSHRPWMMARLVRRGDGPLFVKSPGYVADPLTVVDTRSIWCGPLQPPPGGTI